MRFERYYFEKLKIAISQDIVNVEVVKYLVEIF